MAISRLALAAWIGGFGVVAAIPLVQAQTVEKHEPAPAEAVREAPAFQGFSDNTLGLRYGSYFKEPGVAQSDHSNRGTDIDKVILNFSHFDVTKYWSNFISIDVLQSNARDPSNNQNAARKNETLGATEIYGVYRGNLSGNAVVGGDPFKFGPIKDITLEIGGDINTKNTAFAPQKKLLVFGPNFHFDVPGFFNVGIHLHKEWNYNGIVGKSVDFDPTLQIEPTYLIPLTFTSIPLRIEGFADLNLPKGRDGFGAKTVTELLSHTDLVLDVGQVLLSKPNFLDGFIGFEYWLNKFGNDNTKVPGSLAYSPYIGLRVHF